MKKQPAALFIGGLMLALTTYGTCHGADGEQLATLKNSVSEWDSWRAANPGAIIDLSGAVLNEADLRQANLSGANLSRADLRFTSLYGANLSGANLSRANLSNADLRQANLSGADLSGTNLSGANLSGANVSRDQLRGARGGSGR